MWKPPPSAATASTPGPSVRPAACSRNASSTAAMQSRRVSSSRTSRRARTRMLGPPRGGGVEAFEQRHALGEDLLIVGRRGQQRAHGNVDAASFLVGILPVTQVRFVHDFGQPREAPIAEVSPLHQRLECAVLAVVAQLRAGRVEGNRVLWKLGGRREDELRVPIDEALDQPRRRDAVDVRARTGDPPPAAQPGEVEGRVLFTAKWFRTSGTHGDDLLETPHLGAAGGVEVIDVTDALVLLGQARELFLQPRLLSRGLRVEALEDLAVARRELAVIVIAWLVEHSPQVLGADVLDLLDPDQRGLAALALDLLGEPLEVFVSLGRIGQEIRGAFERHRAERPQPAPYAHAEARRGGWHADQQQEERAIHAEDETLVSKSCQVMRRDGLLDRLAKLMLHDVTNER